MFYKKASLCLILLSCTCCGVLYAIHLVIATITFGAMTFIALMAYT